MDQRIDILDNNVTVEVKNSNFMHGNHRTILFQIRGINHEVVSNLEINISDKNFKELWEILYPHGLMLATHEERLAMLNCLIEELGPVYDYENPEFYISGVKLDHDEDRLYFDCKEDKEWQKK